MYVLCVKNGSEEHIHDCANFQGKKDEKGKKIKMKRSSSQDSAENSVHIPRLERIFNTSLLLLHPPFIIDIPEPFMRDKIGVIMKLFVFPRLGRENIMDILDLVIPPDTVVHALPPQRLERIVHIWQRNPAAAEEVRQQRLIRKSIICGFRFPEGIQDAVVHGFAGIDDLEASIHVLQTGGTRGASFLRLVR